MNNQFERLDQSVQRAPTIKLWQWVLCTSISFGLFMLVCLFGGALAIAIGFMDLQAPTPLTFTALLYVFCGLALVGAGGGTLLAMTHWPVLRYTGVRLRHWWIALVAGATIGWGIYVIAMLLQVPFENWDIVFESEIAPSLGFGIGIGT